MVTGRWFDTHELRNFTVLTFTNARQNSRLGGEGEERVNGGGCVKWYSNSESVSVPGRPKTQGRGKIEEDTGCEKK